MIKVNQEFVMYDGDQFIYVINDEDNIYVVKTSDLEVARWNYFEDAMVELFEYIEKNKIEEIQFPDEDYMKMFFEQVVLHYEEDDITEEVYNYILCQVKVN